MARLPRGACPDCGRDVAIRKGGYVRERQAFNVVGRTEGKRYEKCPGSGKHLTEWGRRDD